MPKTRTYLRPNSAALAALIALAPSLGWAQQPPKQTTPAAVSTEAEDEVVQLSPFEVLATDDKGYVSTTTLAGNRLNTDIRDLGTSLSIYNTQFLKDIAATDNQSLLKYTLGTEIGGINGNYSGSGGGTAPDKDASYLSPQSSNRVRGLVAADSTRDLYLTGISWDGYNVEAVDLQRGPNALLFGQGSAGGVINTRTKQAMFRNKNEATMRVDQYGTTRATVDFNRELLKNELAVRIAAVDNRTKFKQEPAFENYNREFAAIRYEPSFLNKGVGHTILKADFERGNSYSNRPRNMPPGDNITPWFTALNKATYNDAWINNNHTELPGRGAVVQTSYDGTANANYQPWLNTNFGNNYYGGAEFFYNSGSATPTLGLVINPNTYLGVDSTGKRDGSIGGVAAAQPHGIRGYRDWAIATNQPFASLTKNKSITDTNIFDFYNKLIDGDIKREWSNFSTYDVSLSQTFFGETMGFDIGYHEEKTTDGSYSPLVGDSGNIYVDYNTMWADGTPNADGGWYTDGTANTGVGRAFVQLGNGRGETDTDRSSLRATAFISHDFDKREKSWWRRILGTQTVTGLASRDTSKRYSHSWVGATFVGSYYDNPMFAEIKANNGRFWADFVPIRTVYISDSLANKKLGDNFGINGPATDPALSDKMTLRYFDSAWKATGVNPADPWYNNVSAGTTGGPALSTQSENPANYVGWVTKEVSLMRDDTAAHREYLTTGRTWDDRYNNAFALSWQGKFWNNSVVVTGGVRHDKVGQTLTEWNRDASTDDPTQIPSTVTLTGPIKKNSRSRGVVAHLNSLPLLGDLRLVQRLPVDISLSYNRSSNFQTGQVFVDYWGQALPLPKGETKDWGLAVATKDGKYSFRVNKFESAVKNNVSSGLQFWNYGNNIGIFASAYHQIKYNYETRGNPNSTRHGTGVVSDLPIPTDSAPNTKWNFDYIALNGQTQAQAEAQEIAVIKAWDDWIASSPLPTQMAKAWSFSWDGSDFTEQGIAFRFTEDLLAEGYEYELAAQVTDNWRVAVNASRIKSYRDNIGQTLAPDGKTTMIEYLLDFDKRLRETAMGDLRIWGPGGSANARENWAGYADGDLKARLAEQGTVVPENRLWHINLISNYDFTSGRLKGWSVGGAMRYQSASTLAYKPIQHTNPSYISYDLSQPYRDDPLTDFDVWIGYGRKVYNNKIDWRVQLNVQNVGVGNELLPVTVQPDGSVATYRIRPPQQISITNSFTF